jgi:hypothetical protein
MKTVFHHEKQVFNPAFFSTFLVSGHSQGFRDLLIEFSVKKVKITDVTVFLTIFNTFFWMIEIKRHCILNYFQDFFLDD